MIDKFMIVELYSVFKPLVMVFASIIIPVVGIILFFGCCTIAVKMARLLSAAVKNRSWNVRSKIRNKISACVERFGIVAGEKIAAEIERYNKAKREDAKAQRVDLRSRMVGKWCDTFNAFEIYDEEGIYILTVISCRKEPRLNGEKFILRASFWKGLNSNIFTTAGTYALDLAYSTENDTIFVSDFGTTCHRMNKFDEDYFKLNEPEGTADIQPIPPVSQEELDKVFCDIEPATPFEELEERVGLSAETRNRLMGIIFGDCKPKEDDALRNIIE